MKIPQFVYRLIGKYIGKKLKLEEDMGDGIEGSKKKWYKSKGVLAGIVTVLITLYTGVDSEIGPLIGFDLPDIPLFIFTILGALGVYGRVKASEKIG